MWSSAKLLQALFHGLDLGLESSQVRLDLGGHLGLAPVPAAKSAVATAAAAAAPLAAVTAASASRAVTAAPVALGGAATLAAGLALAVRLAFTLLAMMLVMVLLARLAVGHDQPLFRGLAERCSAMVS